MCGIVGYISLDEAKYIKEKEHFMHYALMLDTLRGMDSTGLIEVAEPFKVGTKHSILPGDQFVHTHRYTKNNGPAWCKVGHNRAATKGSVSLANAHPFNFGDVTLVHNGTLAQGGRSIGTFNPKLEVDSMQIALALSKSPPEDAAKVLGTIDGSFALVWADERDNSINMARNMDRPIHFTYNSAKDIMWFMSDGHHLQSINKSLSRYQAGGNTIYQMDKHKVLKFTQETLVPEVTTFVPFVRAVVTTTRGVPSTTSGSTASGGLASALKKAAKRWLTNTEQARTPGVIPSSPAGNTTPKQASKPGLKEADLRVVVNGKERKLVRSHVAELEREYDLRPTDLVEFMPIVKYKQTNGGYTVIGDVVHGEWGDSEWDAVIYDVGEVEAEMSWHESWTVHPVGLSRPHATPSSDTEMTVPSVLCTLVDTNYKNVTRVTHNEEAESPILIPVGSRYVEAKLLDKMMEEGCVQCGANITLEDSAACIIVNDGRDLLCAGCQMELNPASNEHRMVN